MRTLIANGTVVTAPNDGSFANSTVNFGGLDLPVIAGETHAFGNERMNVNAFGYQTYTYTRAADSPFSITGNLHIVSASGPNGFLGDPDNLSGVFAGGAFDFATPFALLCGFGVVTGYALLGACWLVMKTEGALQQWARKKARIALFGVVIFIAIVSIWRPVTATKLPTV